MSVQEYINCPNCFTKYNIPRTDKLIKITCKNCYEVFYKNLKQTHKKQINKFIIPGIILAIIIVFFWYNEDSSKQGNKPRESILSWFKSSNWVTIDYSDLVKTTTLTHSGETVGTIIKKIPNYKYTNNLNALIQQYMEPFSVLCHDVLLTNVDPDTLPLVNILAHYPIGSDQPAWVDLFREGHYQLYYNAHLIRVFLKGSNKKIKGSNPKSSFEKHRSVIRHPIRDVINSSYTSIKKVEVYVFSNDYAKTEIRLNTIPEAFSINELDLSPRRKSIDLKLIF